jgi:hypothetical protein
MLTSAYLRSLHDINSVAISVPNEVEFGRERHRVAVDALQQSAAHAKRDALWRVAGTLDLGQ